VEPVEFEVKQSLREEPLSLDPVSGMPVKRVITGGYISSPKGKKGGGCCGGGCGCH
jgi:hypothetical protein